MIITVARIETMFKMKVRSKYFAINGMESEVGGRILETSNKKTTKANKIEIPSVIFSEHSAGRKNTAIDKNAINTVGIINMTV